MPATYNWNGSNALSISLATGESLAIVNTGSTSPAYKFTLSGGTDTWTATGNTADGGASAAVLSFNTNADLASSLAIDNNSAAAGANNVTFTSGTISSGAITVNTTTTGTTSIVTDAAAANLTAPAGGTVTLNNGAGAVTFSGTLNGGYNLVDNATGLTTFGAIVGGTTPLASISVVGATTYAAAATALSTTGNQTYATSAGAVTLKFGTVFTGSTVTFDGKISGAFNWTVNGNATFSVAVGGTAMLALTVNGTSTIDSTVQTINFLTFNGPVILGGGSGAITSPIITFGSTVDDGSAGVNALALTGNATFAGAVGSGAVAGTGAPKSLSVSGTTAVTGTSVGITTTAGQTYSGAVTLGANTTLTGTAIAFSSTVDDATAGKHALTLTNTGKATFTGVVGGAASLGSLSVSGASVVNTTGITTTGNQTYSGAVTVGAPTTLTTGGLVTFQKAVNDTAAGTDTLTVAGNATFAGVVGGTAPLSGLSVSGTSGINAAGVSTTGNQTYTGAVSIGASTTLTAGLVTFGTTVDDATAGTDTLAVAGNATFGGVVGGATPLGSLSVSGTSGINAAGVSTTGNQTYTGAVTVGTSTSLSTGTLTAGAIASTGGVTINDSGAGSIAGPISGSGATLVKTGAGTLTLTGANSYTGATTVSAGALLADNTTGSATGTNTVTVASGATLGGTGTVTGAVVVSGTVAPGGTALLNTGNLSFATPGSQAFSAEVNGTSPGSGYDQVTVTGTVNLTGSTLNLTTGAGLSPVVGTQFVLIANNGTSAVTGTFSGYPEGSAIVVGALTFTISYIGGDGNDVVLTLTRIATTTAVSAASPSTTVAYGTAVTFTATVTAASGTAAPTGSVTFYDNGNSLGTATTAATIGNGFATYTYTTTATQLQVNGGAAHDISAVFTAGPGFGNSTSSGAGDESETITPDPLTVTGVTAANRQYDGGTDAPLNTGAAGLAGTVYGTDDVHLDSSAAVGTFASKDVNTGITVTTSGFALAGAQAGDYVILTQPTATAKITPATLTVVGVTAANRQYDGGTDALLNTGSAGLGGTVYGSDDVHLDSSAAVGTFASKDVNTGITVTTTGFALAGAQAAAGDYVLLTQPTLTANISPVALVITAVTNAKFFDNTTSAAAVPTITSGTIQPGDTADFIETYDTPAVGTGKTLTPSGTVVDGDGGNDYTYTFVSVNTGVIENAVVTTTSVATSRQTVTYGTGFTLTAVVTSASGTPTGSVTFYDDSTGASLGTGTLLSSGDGQSTWTYTTTPTQLDVIAGSNHAIRAVFSPTGSYGSSAGTLSNGETVAPLALTVTGVTAFGKVYDDNVAATLDTTGAALDGVLGTDDARLVSTGVVGSFVSKDVNNGIGVTTAGFALTGTQAGDYTLTQPTASANITPATLTIAGVAAANKVYDGATTAPLTGTPTLVGLYAGDAVTPVSTGAVGTFANKDVNTGILVAITGFTLTGAQAGDYVVAPLTTSANITPATLTVTGVTASDRQYDGLTDVTLNTGSAVLNGTVFGTDDVHLAAGGAAGAFASKDVNTGILVTTSGFALTGNQASDYTVTQPTTTASITPAPLTVTGVTANNKVYDGGTAATLGTARAELVGTVYGSDVVIPNSTVAVGAFASKDVNTGITVTASGFALAGAQAGDYVILTQPTTTANITPATLTVTGVTAGNKVYDGTTTATVNTGGAALSGAIYGSDDVHLAAGGAVGAFASKDVNTGILVTTSGFALTGNQASDYTVTQPTTTASITPATLTVTGATANNRSYDGATDATLNTGGATLTGTIYGSDDVHLAVGGAVGAFTSKDVNAGIAVTTSGFALTGNQAVDYTLTQPTTTANITPATLAVTSVTAGNKVYDGTTTATVNTSGATLTGTIYGSDDVHLAVGGAVGAFTSKDVNAGITVTTSGFALTGNQAVDYTLTQPTATASITPATLTVTGVTAGNKVYDGTTTATLNTGAVALAGAVFGTDDVHLISTGATGTFASKDVNTGIGVTTSGFALIGNQAVDYTLIQPTTTASIAPATLTVTGVTANDRPYDGATDATLNAGRRPWPAPCSGPTTST
ncbi:YDG domain-containing protein [Fimbriiglobus ruber]|uniref:YDG domain-containing protein n=1 Tax=Fimbriiglobus ruber TaxID=1908690 RepID=UPI00117A5E14|nr:YDG domain-containing protein [Fimbriiglobus ruber]